MGSLVLLTYAGVLLAFSVEVPEDAARDIEAPAGARAVVVPIASPASVRVRGDGEPGALLATGEAAGSFPSGATDVRMGRALVHVPAGANGTFAHGNATIDLAAASGGAEGWLIAGPDDAPWFAPADATLGEVVRFESPARMGLLFGVGTFGFVAPLIALIVTHRGAKRAPDAPVAFCPECRAPMAGSAEFCMRCGAWRAREETQGRA